MIIRVISGFHEGHFEDTCLLACCGVYSGTSLPTFQKSLVPLSSGLHSRKQIYFLIKNVPIASSSSWKCFFANTIGGGGYHSSIGIKRMHKYYHLTVRFWQPFSYKMFKEQCNSATQRCNTSIGLPKPTVIHDPDFWIWWYSRGLLTWKRL